MDNKSVIELLKANVADCRERGLTLVPLENIEKLANELEADPELVADDKLREHQIDLSRQLSVESYKARVSGSSKRFEYRVRRGELMTNMTVKTAENAVKSLLIVNGGAALALLAFFGAIARTSAELANKVDVANALAIFTAGAFMAAVTSCMTYFSQAGFGQEFGSRSMSMGNWFRCTAISSAAVSAGSFVFGAWIAARAFGADIF